MLLARPMRLLLLVTCLLGVEQIIADKTDPEFPDIKGITYGSYQSTVEVSLSPENTSVYVTEYYDEVAERGRLDLLIDGKRTTLLYDKETMQMVIVLENTCTVVNITSALINSDSIFWGWLDHRPGHVLIGPSAILRKALDSKPEYLSNAYIRGIKCNMWSHQDPENKEVIIEYYFTEPSWTNANGLNKVIPVRVSVYGNAITSLSDGKKIKFDQVFDFVAYSPYVRYNTAFQPSVGIGCMSRKNIKPVPKIGSKIFYLGEEYNLKEKEDHMKSSIHLYKIYFDSLFKLVRFDSWEEKGLNIEIQDFNTGIAYSIDNEKRCNRGPIRGSPAEKLGWGFVGTLKTTEEFLSLKGDYYYVGYDTIRGIRCDVWENIITNVTMGDQFYVRVVYTYYFMTQWWEAIVDGVTEEQRPVRFTITGYEKIGEPPTLKKQFNMYGFRDTGIDMDLFKKFSIEDCEFLDGKEYFQVVFNVNRTQAVIAEMNDNLFRTYMLILLASEMTVSPIRLPFIRADYSESSILVTATLLDKPPEITGFYYLNVDEFNIPGSDEKNVGRVEDKNECAVKCLSTTNPKCKSIHYCEHTCFINTKDLSESWGNRLLNYKNCDFYMRSVADNSEFDVENERALKNLEEKVNKGFVVSITPPTSDSEVHFIATSVIKNVQINNLENEAYNIVAEHFQLDKYSQTTKDIGDVGTKTDCFKKCRDAESIICSSFSYCNKATNRACRISSVLIRKENKMDRNELEPNTQCNVYTRDYLFFFHKYRGKVFLTGGDKSLDGLTSPEECAMKCRLETDFVCRGFEYCEDKRSCVLHKKHVLDMKPSNMVTAKATCSHYAIKYIADFLNMGHTLVDDEDSLEIKSLTLEECARLCSEQSEYSCNSFNYCPSDSLKDHTNAFCYLSSKTLTTSGVKTKDSITCQHYARKDAVNDWGYKNKKLPETQNKAGSGYTKGGLAGLLIGMLILGAFIGAFAFLLFSYYKSRKAQGGLKTKFVNNSSETET